MLKLFRFLKPYALAIAAVVALVAGQAIAELYLPTLMGNIVDQGVAKGDTAYILRTGGLMLIVAMADMACAFIAAFLSARAGMGFGRDLRRKVFTHVEEFSLHEFDIIGTPSLITRTTNDITQVQMFTMLTMRMLIMAPIMAVGGVIMALEKDAHLWWVIAAVIPIVAVVVGLTAGKAIPLFRSIQKKIDRINLVLREGLTGVRVVRAFNRVDHERARFDEANLDLTNVSIRVNKLMALMMPLMMLIMNLTMIAIIWFGAQRIDMGDMQVGSLMAFLQYAMQILMSLLMVSMLFIMLPRASASSAQDQRGARPEAGDQGRRFPAKDRHGARSGRGRGARLPGVPQRHLRLPRRGGAGHHGHLLQRETGRGDRHHWRHRLGKVDTRQPGAALLRHRLGLHPRG